MSKEQRFSKDDSNSTTTTSTASVYLRLRPDKKSNKNYTYDKNTLKVTPIEGAFGHNIQKHFEFLQIFHMDSSWDVYTKSIESSIQHNENRTILTYGASGSGKTYTMFGSENDAGIVQRAIVQIYAMNANIICATPAARIHNGHFSIVPQQNVTDELNKTAQFESFRTRCRNNDLVQRICNEHGFRTIDSDWNCAFVWISFAEIYKENVYDLLEMSVSTIGDKRKGLKIVVNDRNVYIKDLTSVHVTSASNAFDVINSGLAKFKKFAKANGHLKRSHCILMVDVVHFSYPDRYSMTTLKFGDLAGSELLTLHRCVELMHKNQHSKSKEVIPFRESKLTILLQKSLIGHEKITTIVTMDPNVDLMNENLHVLKFASIGQQIEYKCAKPERRDDVNYNRFERSLLKIVGKNEVRTKGAGQRFKKRLDLEQVIIDS